MSEITIAQRQHFDELTRIFANAYPSTNITSDEAHERLRDRFRDFHEDDPTSAFYVLLRDGAMQGVMCLYDFTMNFLQAPVPAKGLGQMAVHLAHKKEHVAKEMVQYYLHWARDEDAPLAVLYPFRPDFYRQMGFGYGARASQYRLTPNRLPKGPAKDHVRYAVEGDRAELKACYQRVARRTHGMIDKTARDIKRLFESRKHRIAVYARDGQIQGYLVFSYEQGNTFILNDILVQEYVFETPEAMSELLTFLHSQADQIRHIIIDTFDDDFYHALFDPRNHTDNLFAGVYHETNLQGVGLMVRILDVAGLFRRLGERDFQTPDLTLKLEVEDTFLPESAGDTLLRFEGGRVRVLEGGAPEVTLSLAIQDLSSLLVGTVSFRSLLQYGLAEISDVDYVDTLNRLFTVEQKPVCVTQF